LRHFFICPAGNDTISVDSNGDVYPCFMFYRNVDFQIGTVLLEQEQTLLFEKQKEFLSSINPISIVEVSSSWAKD
jgi:uncharacterized protein